MREVARLEASRRPSVSARVPSVKLRTRSARPETARACAECATAARTGRVETNALCQFLVLFLDIQIPSSSARPPNGPPGWNFPTNKRLDRRKSRHQLGIILGRARIQSEGVDREIVRRTRVPRADTNLELQTETFVGPLSVGLPVVSAFFLPGTVSRAGLLACTSSRRGEGSRDTTYAAGAVRAPTHARERARGALGRSSRARSFTPVRSRRDLALSGRGRRPAARASLARLGGSGGERNVRRDLGAFARARWRR